jgi:hypothetical protein
MRVSLEHQSCFCCHVLPATLIESRPPLSSTPWLSLPPSAVAATFHTCLALPLVRPAAQQAVSVLCYCSAIATRQFLFSPPWPAALCLVPPLIPCRCVLRPVRRHWSAKAPPTLPLPRRNTDVFPSSLAHPISCCAKLRRVVILLRSRQRPAPGSRAHGSTFGAQVKAVRCPSADRGGRGSEVLHTGKSACGWSSLPDGRP